MEKYQEIPSGFKQIVRSTILEHFKQQSQTESVSLHELNTQEKQLVYAHWMSLIMIANNNFRLIIKAHYNCSSVEEMNSSVLPHKPRKEIIHDYMREFCNLIGGNIKALFEQNQIQSGLSLPLVTRGFDEIFTQFNNSNMNLFDQFLLSNKDAQIFFTIHFEVIDNKIIDNINQIQSKEDASEGDIEFL